MFRSYTGLYIKALLLGTLIACHSDPLTVSTDAGSCFRHNRCCRRRPDVQGYPVCGTSRGAVEVAGAPTRYVLDGGPALCGLWPQSYTGELGGMQRGLPLPECLNHKGKLVGEKASDRLDLWRGIYRGIWRR